MTDSSNASAGVWVRDSSPRPCGYQIAAARSDMALWIHGVTLSTRNLHRFALALLYERSSQTLLSRRPPHQAIKGRARATPDFAGLSGDVQSR